MKTLNSTALSIPRTSQGFADFKFFHFESSLQPSLYWQETFAINFSGKFKLF